MFLSLNKRWVPAFIITLIYVIFTALWITFSNNILELFIDDPRENIQAQIIKDWASFLITAVFLYILVYYFFSRLQIARESFQESERQMKTMINNLPGMVYRCKNDEKLTALFIGGNCHEITGYQSEDFVNNNVRSFVDIIHPEDVNINFQEAQTMVTSRDSRIYEYRIITASKAIRWIWEKAQGVFDKDGNLLYIEGFLMDITDERSNEKALEYYGDFLNNIINNIPFPLFYKDLQGRFLGCNQHFSDYLGMDYNEIIGRTSQDLFANSAAFYEAGDRELLETGEQQKYETSILFPDGKVRNAVFYKSVFYDTEGEPEGIIGVYFDISERIAAENTIRKQMEELERINKELERFTYTVSHDLRSPLVTIKGFLGMLREDILANDHEQVENDMQRISNAADKMHYLLEDLLQLSRIGRVGNPFISFPMSRAVEEVLEYLDGIIREEKARIIIQPNMPHAFGDRSRIMEVYQNLIENALKFKSPDRELIVEIGCRLNEPVNVFYVKDNGVGIDETFQKKIFGLFNKLDPRTAGTGIGLALVQRIVEFHEGRVWVESQGEGKGACFCFTLGSK